MGSATFSDTPVIVDGYITDCITEECITGVQIIVVCDKTGEPYDPGGAGAGGYYFLTEGNFKCPSDSSVTVTASKQDYGSGTNTGYIDSEDGIWHINLCLGGEIPEFSTIMIPFLMSLAGFGFLRGKSII